MLRRSLLKAAAALPAASLFGADSFDVAAEERPRVLRGAAKYLNEPPITVIDREFAAQRRRQARLFLGRRLLVARSEESRWSLYPARRHEQPG